MEEFLFTYIQSQEEEPQVVESPAQLRGFTTYNAIYKVADLVYVHVKLSLIHI